MDERKRRLNEKNFTFWEEISEGGRRYWYEVPARHLGWKARYVKEVDANEITTKFYQEICNDKGELVVNQINSLGFVVATSVACKLKSD